MECRLSEDRFPVGPTNAIARASTQSTTLEMLVQTA
jgi:hypothetical protein